MFAKALPLFSIILLLFPMGVFMLASLPLLVLKHDTPTDGRFIRGLFNLYYVSVITIGVMGAAACALTAQGAVAVAMAGLVAFVFAVRRLVISNMDKLRGEMSHGDSTAVPRFRRLHIAGMALNVVQLGTVAWGLTRLAT